MIIDESHEVYRFYSAHAEVAKSGIWDPQNHKYYYCDITQGSFHILDLIDMSREDYSVGLKIGAMALIEGGTGLVMAVRDGFGIWDFATKKFELVATPYGINSGWRMNDGNVDSKGRFWAGRLFDTDETKPGMIYRLELDGKTATPVIDGICCTNGVLWSPDNKRMYCGDSTHKKIYVWDYEEESGTPSNQRLFFDTASYFSGVPDGANIDSDGYLWVCFYDGNHLVRISPDAKVDRVYNMPVKRPTQPVWFGENMDELLVTSASKDVNRNMWPESGNILKLHAGVQGQLKNKYRLASAPKPNPLPQFTIDLHIKGTVAALRSFL
ncbi:hypothetical protein MPTK1_5g00240 [Marchantia polymorpha subsp. ruderalis]|uniref:SMP-30/Gluconolactonase/LRE-like region domain-containing protein n=2 Tax=Marchantia polymorpha TaxID=3197 RepID=A0A176WNF5_MARPO|nr:hypothetical protein AXG93_4034s1000 [Marchantia polymorpha subsp. ruderalis]PTQ34614.1 hypothetical protein MARPO_0078s0026 [Marchantia polymorpha]BBN10019.1 hypothetical protein Mp_5g00240 [Marchantia polymorpha subsp. ruderalis]|eukprot:PTQ34614.1 hypothetical protein MARPO_0078s0026 [Marchantia polymorpha]